ncbi:hypothetical protein TVAG_166390 [Trichomonas vaginalis G3]|uniref:Uncharacterized protein n=1 Tax=Trichomonas vaginalis (strain ATCC PRA-98 / G3) TaxID=412133 RepID=A2DE46_TRIV3|nr:SCA1 complex scaffold protein SCAA family [Trichomonas vaginalis G3]EAY21264.1 hypothetical protein TVAG_166390 [Trichomonas vaginalis G3]KAI5548838.1 SCA1 complex scaffold protein SCAA family [Trichomonas vaginalis G3]|eukprot:XP_001582250.1 hypothetical protein [Trichomonas vaginalis G3]
MKQTNKDVFSHEEYAKYFDPSKADDTPIPSPLNFKSYDEYSKELSKWYTNKTKTYASALLPIPIAGQIYIPSEPKIFTPEEKQNPSRMRTFKAQQWPLLPKNYAEMLGYIENNSEIDPEAEFKEQYPKREKIYMKHHISSSPQWMEQKVPQEPIPEFYDTLEEYEEAYKRWASVADDMFTISIPSVEEMEKIALIDVVKPTETSEMVPATDIPESPLDPRIIELAKNTKLTQFKLLPILEEIKEPLPKKQESESLETYQIFVYGVDPQVFLNDMINYGLYKPTTSTLRPCHPVHPHVFINGDKSLAEPLLLSSAPIDQNFISDIINIFVADIVELFSYNKDGVRASEAFFKFLSNEKNLEEFIARSELSQRIKYSSSQFLLNLVENVEDSRPLTDLLENNLTLLRKFVKLLTVASNEVHFVYTGLDDSNSPYNPILKGYLFSVIFEIFSKCTNASICDVSRTLCQRYCVEIAKLINDANIHSRITSDLNSDTMNDGTRAALMILNLSSPHVHRILFSHSFISWINDMSKFKNGIIFIETLSYSNALDAIALMMLGPLCATIGSKLKDLTEQTSYCLRRILYHLFSLCEKVRITFNGTNLVEIFDTLSSLQIECLSTLVAPIAKIIVCKSMISNYKDNIQTFRETLQASVTKLCQSATESSSTQFRQQLQALKILSIDTSCAKIMIKHEPFMIKVFEHLTSNDMNTVFLSWDFLELLSKDSEAFKMLPDNETYVNKICDFPSKSSLVTVRKLIEFSFKIWNSHDPTLTSSWNKVISRAIKLIYSYQHIFKNDKRMKELNEEFFSYISKSKNPDFKNVKEELKKAEEDSQSSKKK